eukprot:SAG22_NODE_192_length_15668_cov_4.492389_11_plen_92_part_00
MDLRNSIERVLGSDRQLEYTVAQIDLAQTQELIRTQSMHDSSHNHYKHTGLFPTAATAARKASPANESSPALVEYNSQLSELSLRSYQLPQ